jgi:uncharacterized protein YcbX
LPVTVSQLAIAPVKGMRLQHSSEIELGHHGVIGDREFLIVDDDGKLISTSRNPRLLRIEPSWEPTRNLLALRFPDGSIVQDAPEPGTAAVTRMYDGREVPGRVIPGPLSAALSGYLGRAVHLFKRAADHFGNDDRPVTLMSEASLHALAAEFSGTAPDARRFRMSITVTGVDPWAEHGWSGQQVTVGDIALRVLAPVPRCVVTTRNPESGATDARILHALARLRGKDDITFGVWCDVIQPGPLQVGDVVLPP